MQKKDSTILCILFHTSGQQFINLDDSIFVGGHVELNTYEDYGITATVDASSNEFTINGGEFAIVIGGEAEVVQYQGTATANTNTLTLNNVAAYGAVYGGKAHDEGLGYTTKTIFKADSNTLKISGGTYEKDVFVGYANGSAATAEANGNHL